MVEQDKRYMGGGKTDVGQGKSPYVTNKSEVWVVGMVVLKGDCVDAGDWCYW
jgi:hypothetical protein